MFVFNYTAPVLLRWHCVLHMCNMGSYYYFSAGRRGADNDQAVDILCDTTRVERGFRVADIHLVFWGGNDDHISCGREGETKTGVRRLHRNHEILSPDKGVTNEINI